MTCYHPLQAWKAGRVNPETGKVSLVFASKDLVERKAQFFRYSSYPFVKVPCSQCIGCRLRYSRDWAFRIYHEASLYEQNCFVTLTYSEENLPYVEGLRHQVPVLHLGHIQSFIKRLRKRFTGRKIRYFLAGEYGEKFGRPHYHLCLFNVSFSDLRLLATYKGNSYYTSDILEKLWPYGYVSISELTFNSAAYVARYVTKKVNGALSDSRYMVVDENGEVFYKKKEFATMSRRSGIGKEWFDKYVDDIFPRDSLVLRGGKLVQPPRYYDKLYELTNSEAFIKIKDSRVSKAKSEKVRLNNTPRRLSDRKIVKEKLMSLFMIRSLG